MNARTQTIILVIFAIFCFGCKKTTSHTFLTIEDPEDNSLRELKLSISLPPEGVAPMGNGLYPGLVFVHGGSWESGSRGGEGLANEIDTAASKGYVAITVDYRLTSEKTIGGQVKYPWPAQIQDVNCAIRWLKAHAGDYQLDTAKIGIYGGSAGGQLAFAASEFNQDPSFESPQCEHNADSSVNAVVTYAGAADLIHLWENSAIMRPKLRNLLGSELDADGDGDLEESDRTRLSLASPVDNLSSLNPIFMVHASNDIIVPIGGSHALLNALELLGREPLLVELDRGGHTLGGVIWYADILMYEWLDSKLRGAPFSSPCADKSTCEVVVPSENK